MKVSIKYTEGHEFNCKNANAAFYSETHDCFIVDVGGVTVLKVRMGDIAELEIYE